MGDCQCLADVLPCLLVGLWSGEIQGRAKEDKQFPRVKVGLPGLPLYCGAIDGLEVAWIAIACHDSAHRVARGNVMGSLAFWHPGRVAEKELLGGEGRRRWVAASVQVGLMTPRFSGHGELPCADRVRSTWS